MSDIQATLLQLMEKNPEADNHALAVAIREVHPGSKTSAASVSSMKSRMRSTAALGGSVASGLDTSGLVFDGLPDGDDDEETLDEAKERINLRYKAMERMGRGLVSGKMPSLIVSGPPGLGKSYTLTEVIDEMEASGDLVDVMSDKPEELSTEEYEETLEGKRMYDSISGSITAVGLYQALWATRKGGVLLLDDIDEVFRDEVCMNLLKAALDSGKKRTLSWRKEAHWLEEYGIAKKFDYQGHVVFLTNIDFESEIEKNGKMTEHFKALIDRSFYLCLTLRSKRDFMIRIRQVCEGEEGMCASMGLTEEQTEEALEFVADHQSDFYNLSLRLVGQIAKTMTIDPDGWRDDILATKTRTR